MAIFRIVQTWKHTEEIFIEAEDKSDALAKAQSMDFARNHDDTLYSEEIMEIPA